MPSPVDDAYSSEYSRPSETEKLRMPFFRGRYRLTGKTYPNPNPNPNPNVTLTLTLTRPLACDCVPASSCAGSYG